MKSFPDAIAFVTRLAFDAEAATIIRICHVNYKKVTGHMVHAQRRGRHGEGLCGRQAIGDDCRTLSDLSARTASCV
jgi:hypothetical protein